MPHTRHSMKVVRIAQNHSRLIAAFVIGIVLSLVLPRAWPTVTRLLIGWNVSCALYLVLAFQVISQFDLASVRRRACEEDEGGLAVLVLTVSAAIASLIAIVVELGPLQSKSGETHLFSFGLAATTILLSWAFIHLIFALHYAHQYYGEGDSGTGLDFPGDERVNKPDYWDFLYFSFVIGMTFQVSDVQVEDHGLRRLVLAHGVVAFLFNVIILAVTINIIAGLI